MGPGVGRSRGWMGEIKCEMLQALSEGRHGQRSGLVRTCKEK